MKSSESTDKIALAYVAAWAALTNPAKDGKANYGKYTTLPALLDHVKPELTANGLAVTQDETDTERGIGTITRLIHTSGQFYEYGPLVLPAGNTAQTGGSAITYGRRYQLAAALGIAADTDDDGAAASKPPEPTDTARRGSGTAGPGAAKPDLASGSAPSSESGEAHSGQVFLSSTNSTPGSESPEAGGDGEGPAGPATPEQRTRLLQAYKNKPAAVKAKAVELFGYPSIGDVIVGDLTAAEVEALILEKAS